LKRQKLTAIIQSLSLAGFKMIYSEFQKVLAGYGFLYTPISEVEYIIGTQSLSTDQLYDLCCGLNVGVFESFDDALKYYKK